MKIFLTGFMGAGKTSIGLLLAHHFNIPFFDQDRLLETQYGITAGGLFEREGEARFRELERELLLNFEYPEAFVFSTGGGCPCFHGNMDWINQHGISIYLAGTASLLATRLEKHKATRPLIMHIPAAELEADVTHRLAARAPFYELSALHVPLQEGYSKGEVFRDVLNAMTRAGFTSQDS